MIDRLRNDDDAPANAMICRDADGSTIATAAVSGEGLPVAEFHTAGGCRVVVEWRGGEVQLVVVGADGRVWSGAAIAKDGRLSCVFYRDGGAGGGACEPS